MSYNIHVFPLSSDVYGIYSAFRATTSHVLVTLIFDFLTDRESVPYTVLLIHNPHINFDYPRTIGY